MTWLLLSILCSTLIFVIFKLFDRFKISNLQAIVVNYFVAFSVGWATSPFDLSPTQFAEKPWFHSVFILGLTFITLFQLMAWVAQKIGVSAVSITVKMSFVIPIAAGMFLYDERLSLVQMIGVVAALAAVYLSTRKKEKKNKGEASLLLPLLLFVGSGLMDSFLKYNEDQLVPDSEDGQFASLVFLTAGVLGCLFLGFKLVSKSEKLHPRNLVAGLILGIVNYGSIFFLLKALGGGAMHSTVVFPVNNVGIVALSVLIAWTIFKEKITLTNKIGIALGIIAIAMMAAENFY